MVRDHIAERTGRLVELTALLYADGFRHSDLHMINPVAIPERLE